MVERFSDDVRRRRFLKSSAAAGAALLAGCTGGESGDGTTSDGTTSDGTTDDGTTGGSYSVSMKPVGEVTFESVPETWVANNGSWADMGVALGLEPPKGVWLPSRYHTQYYDGIPGVSVDRSSIQKLWGDSGVGKEQFYELDADVHVADPNFLMNRGKWTQADIDEISTQVGPFFGNSIFSTGYPWHEDYPYLSLYEAFEKLAKVFQRQDRYEQFTTLHDEFQSTVKDVVPSSKSERPQVATVWAGSNEPKTFSPYLVGDGTSFKHLRDLQVRDAFAATDVRDFHTARGEVDFETMLEIDPDVLLCRGHEDKTAKEFRNTVVQFMENHSVASELTAVESGDVYRAGPLYQGPITNLVVTDRLARTLYDADQALFDPQRVADIVNGDS